MTEQKQQPVATQRLTVAAGPTGRMSMSLRDAAGHWWFFKFRRGRTNELYRLLRGWVDNPEVPMAPGNASQLMEAAVLAQQLLMGGPPLFDYKPVFRKRAENLPLIAHRSKLAALFRVLRASVVSLLHLRKEEG